MANILLLGAYFFHYKSFCRHLRRGLADKENIETLCKCSNTTLDSSSILNQEWQ